jgi:hypothetical protein
MAKRKAKKKAKKKGKAAKAGKDFSLVGMHNAMRKTLARLEKRKKSKERDHHIDVITQALEDTDCGQTMIIELP